MGNMTVAERDVPGNVRPDQLFDIDFYALPGGSVDAQLAWKRVQDETPPIFWTPRNGGHWIATRAADIEAMQRDFSLFSHRSVSIPPNGTPSLPLEIDPPEHTPLRAVISPMFAPATLKAVEAKARAYSIDLIENLRPQGGCEFIADFSRKLPIAMFLMLVDLPMEDAPHLLELAEIRVRSSDEAARQRVKQELIAYMAKVLDERRTAPGTDFISTVLTATIDGAPITDFQAQNMLSTLLFGGLDTVASMMGFAMRFLAMNPAHRADLVAHPKTIPQALNEIIRRHGLTNTSRVVTRDLDFGDVHFREGDKVVLATAAYNLDERRFPDPVSVDFARPNAGQHGAFGNGPHRCPGANLARTELKVLLEEWLTRIPEFSLDPDRPPVMANGLVNGVLTLPLRWDPATTHSPA